MKDLLLWARVVVRTSNRELKQARRRRQQEPHKFVCLTMKNGSFATGGGGTLGISGWGYAARTLEPSAYTRASFSWILLPYTRVNSPNHPFPSELRFLTVNNIK